MTYLRSVAAVIAGYAVFAVSAVLLFRLAGVDPHAPQGTAFESFTVAYGMAFAALGGFVAARIAPRRAALHAALVGVFIASGAAGSMMASPAADARWTQWAAIFLMAPCAWLAGRIPQRA